MLLLDAIYINNSGGKILLDYLIQELEKTDTKIFYLLDKRVEGKVPYLEFSKNEVMYMEASLLHRHHFYLKKRKMFKKVLCFGDLPPSLKMHGEVYTYFHQQLYIKTPNDLPKKDKILLFLKRKVLNSLLRYSDYWIVQNELIKKNFKNKFKIEDNKMLILPYYPPMIQEKDVRRLDNSYVYISNGSPHKNHTRLIQGFCNFFDIYKTGTLTLTIHDGIIDILDLIKKKQDLGYPIINIGFVERDQLGAVYQSSKYLIYPSLAESFGLGLVEALDCGCEIIGADLKYTYEVCNPSLVFDPLDISSITNVLIESLSHSEIKSSHKKIKNEIKELIRILSY